jgi:hypothetical protein
MNDTLFGTKCLNQNLCQPNNNTNTTSSSCREGELWVWDDKTRKRKKRYFFLFNDILLLTKKEGARKYWLRIYISLRSPYVSVEDSGDSPYHGNRLSYCYLTVFQSQMKVVVVVVAVVVFVV